MTRKKFKGSEKTKENKRLMHEALKKSLGNVTIATEQVGIDRKSHYNWLENDEAYKEAVSEVKPRTDDFVENKLLTKIKNGDTTSIIFYLKTKAKDRGYTERQEIEHSGENRITVESFREAFKNFKKENDKK